MKQLICPRCQEPFGSYERLCKNCGIRKGTSLSKWRWWLIALLVDLLLAGMFAGIREKVNTANGSAMDLSNGAVWLIIGVVFILIPTLCLYFIYLSLLLRKRGVITRGTVVENYTETIRKEDGSRETRQRSVVTFTPEVAHPSQCRVTAGGWLTIGSTVDVIYDPYNPRDYAAVGKTPSLAAPIALAILGLGTVALVIFMMVTPIN